MPYVLIETDSPELAAAVPGLLAICDALSDPLRPDSLRSLIYAADELMARLGRAPTVYREVARGTLLDVACAIDDLHEAATIAEVKARHAKIDPALDFSTSAMLGLSPAALDAEGDEADVIANLFVEPTDEGPPTTVVVGGEG